MTGTNDLPDLPNVDSAGRLREPGAHAGERRRR
jgi:hypothetical protein